MPPRNRFRNTQQNKSKPKEKEILTDKGKGKGVAQEILADSTQPSLRKRSASSHDLRAAAQSTERPSGAPKRFEVQIPYTQQQDFQAKVRFSLDTAPTPPPSRTRIPASSRPESSGSSSRLVPPSPLIGSSGLNSRSRTSPSALPRLSKSSSSQSSSFGSKSSVQSKITPPSSSEIDSISRLSRSNEETPMSQRSDTIVPSSSPSDFQAMQDLEASSEDSLELPLVHQRVYVKEKRNRSINQFKGLKRDLAESAADKIELITFFEEPLPDPEKSEQIIDQAWRDAEHQFGVDHPRDLKVDAYLRSIQSRTRSHLVFKVKESIQALYDFSDVSEPLKIKTYIKKVLYNDRFTCSRKDREILHSRFRAEEAVNFIYENFFKGTKKIGNTYPNFINRISGPFMCLIFAAFHHALTCYVTGAFDFPADFNYQNNHVVFHRLELQWRAFPTTLQHNLLEITRNDLSKRAKRFRHVIRAEPSRPFEVDPEEMQAYAERLALELQMSHEVEERQRYLGGDLTPTEKDYTEDDYSQPTQIDDDATERDPTPTMSEIDSPIAADNCPTEASQPVIINSDDEEGWGSVNDDVCRDDQDLQESQYPI